MRVTIIRDDGFVSVDEVGHGQLDLSVIPAGVHAVQWYHTEGEVEYVDARGRHTHNESITDLAPYAQVLALWQAAQTAHEAEVSVAESATTQTTPVDG